MGVLETLKAEFAIAFDRWCSPPSSVAIDPKKGITLADIRYYFDDIIFSETNFDNIFNMDHLPTTWKRQKMNFTDAFIKRFHDSKHSLSERLRITSAVNQLKKDHPKRFDDECGKINSDYKTLHELITALPKRR